jgi:GT2 family glycosyltransferase
MTSNPKVLIAIPCRNEERFIEACVRSCFRQSYPSELITVTVADGMSDDGTRDVLDGLKREYPNLIIIDNPRRITPVALNIGLRSVIADVKIILGAHAELDEHFVKENVRILQEKQEVGCAGGIIENIEEDEQSRAISIAMSSAFGVGDAHFRTGAKEGYVDTVAFGAYKAEVFEAAGYFDELLVRNQDDELNYRITRAGYRIWLSPDIRSRYVVRASHKKLFRQYYQYGYWKVYVNVMHRAVTTFRQLVPAAFVTYLTIAIAGCIFSPQQWLFLFFPFLVYIFSALFLAVRKSRKLWPAIVLAFLCLHFGYGLGYLKGIFDFVLFGQRKLERHKELTR